MARRSISQAFFTVLLLAGGGLFLRPTVMQAAANSGDESEQYKGTMVEGQVQLISPMSIEMVDAAMAALSKGWSGMSPAEQEIFLLIYDPSNSGQVDDAYVAEVLENYQKIRNVFDQKIDVVYESESDLCSGQRLYYIDPIKLHVCPYFLVEPVESRKARTLIHEVAHIALLALDRPYFGPETEEYPALKPRGHQATQLPVVGPIIREILRNDTLFHPDAYAHFSLAVSGQPGAMALYLGDYAPAAPASDDIAFPESGTSRYVGDFMLRRH